MMTRLKHLDICSGLAGFSLGFEQVGAFDTVGFCEIDEDCQDLIELRYPGRPIFSDLKGLKYERIAAAGIDRVDIITAGLPCQPISAAGKQKGPEDNRWLWPDFTRVVGDLRPRWVLVENPRQLLSHGSGATARRILWEFTQIGYVCEWRTLSVAQFGGPHLRERVWIVAYPAGEQVGPRGQPRICGSVAPNRRFGEQLLPTPLAWDWNRPITDKQRPEMHGGDYLPQRVGKMVRDGLLPTPTASDYKRGLNDKPTTGRHSGDNLSQWAGKFVRGEMLLPTPRASDAERGGRGDLLGWARGYESNRYSSEYPLLPTLVSQSDTKLIGGNLNPEFREWMMGLPIGWTDTRLIDVTHRLDPHVWDDWPSDIPPISPRDELTSMRGKMTGNAIAPVIAAYWGSLIVQAELFEETGEVR